MLARGRVMLVFLPVGMKAPRLIHAYQEAAGHGEDWDGPLFRPVKNTSTVNSASRCIRFECVRMLCGGHRECAGVAGTRQDFDRKNLQ
jgi:hypothetical protein